MSDLRDYIAAGLSTLAARISAARGCDPIGVASTVNGPLSTSLRAVMALSMRASEIVLNSAIYKKPLTPGLPAACSVLCESTSQAMRHIAAAVPPGRYHDRLQLSNAATVFHGIASQFHGPLRAMVTYSDVDNVYGATMASNALGGRPLSPIRDMNAFEAIFGAVEVSPVFINTDAGHAAHALLRSDPVLAPIGAEGVDSYLAAIAAGTRIDP